MKIVFVSKYNSGYLNQLKSKTKSFTSFEKGIEFLQNDFYYHYGSLCYYLNLAGHSTQLLIPNFTALQNIWCTENSIQSASLSEISIVKKQIEKFNPNIVFLNSNFEYYEELIPYLKKKNIKICAWISCPIPIDLELSSIDHIFTLFQPHHNKFSKLGLSSSITNGGFDERILNRPSIEKKYDTSFIGGIGKFHLKREKFLKSILKKTTVDIWGYGFSSTKKWKAIAKQVQHSFAFKSAFNGEAWGKEMFEILSQSRITLNFHGDIAQGHSVNMRLFEATGAGALLLTEDSKSISTFFEPGKEIVVYNSAEDAINKINYYLSNPKKAGLIAKAGQKRTLEDYNYKNIVKHYISTFEALLKNEK